MQHENAIIVFDAECLACSASVRFLLDRDTKRQFYFASIQSEKGAALVKRQGLTVTALDTMLLVDAGRVYSDTDAIIEVLRRLGGIYRLAVVVKVIPRLLRDSLYHLVARNRYRLLGRRTHCFVPKESDRSRFYE